MLTAALVTTGPVAPPEAPVDPATAAVQKWISHQARRTPYPRLVRKLYNAKADAPLFHRGLEPTAQAHALVDMVADLEKHGVDRGPYRMGFAPDNARVNTRGLRKRQARARKRLRPWKLGTARNARAAAATDAKLASALIRYVMTFKYERVAHPLKPTSLRYLRGRKGGEIVQTAVDALPDIQRGLKGLWPQTPNYYVLMDALARYRELAAIKGMPKMSWRQWKRATKKGPASGKVVEQLQQRLAFEGYYQGAITGELDLATASAVAVFRTTHGLKDEGGVDWTVIHAMNGRLRTRVHQLRTGLQRMRESVPLRAGIKTYARINIPAFKLSLIEDGRITRQHRVIVGNTKLDFNRHDWKQGYLNRTPLLETKVQKVILNPEWRPPPRILDEEFDGEENVVVPPGKKNPLGYVKFRLDRTNAVFMHDTNKRRLFNKRKRAFSHGCIRVDKALDLAQYILKNYAGVDAETYEERFSTGRQDPIELTTELRVFVEYSTVDVDAEGRVIFYKDVYKYDRDYLAGKEIQNIVRYGANRMRPKTVPAISHADYVSLKSGGEKAPTEWPITGPEEPPTPEETPAPVETAPAP